MEMTKKNDTCYACEGTCGAVVSEESHDAGLTHCGAEGCTLKGKPLTKKTMY